MVSVAVAIVAVSGSLATAAEVVAETGVTAVGVVAAAEVVVLTGWVAVAVDTDIPMPPEAEFIDDVNAERSIRCESAPVSPNDSGDAPVEVPRSPR